MWLSCYLEKPAWLKTDWTQPRKQQCDMNKPLLVKAKSYGSLNPRLVNLKERRYPIKNPIRMKIPCIDCRRRETLSVWFIASLQCAGWRQAQHYWKKTFPNTSVMKLRYHHYNSDRCPTSFSSMCFGVCHFWQAVCESKLLLILHTYLWKSTHLNSIYLWLRTA